MLSSFQEKKKNRCYIRWNPAYSYRKHRADTSLTKGTPHYLYLLFPVSGAKSHRSCLLKYFSWQSLEEEFKCDPCAHRIAPVQGLLWVLWGESLLESAWACLLAECPFLLGLSWGPWVRARAPSPTSSWSLSKVAGLPPLLPFLLQGTSSSSTCSW